MKKLLVFLSALSIISCSTELREETVFAENETTYLFNESSKSDYDHLLSEYSQLIGNTLKNYEVKSYVDINMDDLTKFGDKISISYLLGDLSGIRKNENDKFLSKKKFEKPLSLLSSKRKFQKIMRNTIIYSQKLACLLKI
ncbi:hypothetical protein [Algibacter sp. R77976]|uniref:hypothetical protein n=1 Tax=Algibacter sp. R77976 TaxID=3093873 RepID=UPI0037C854BC